MTSEGGKNLTSADALAYIHTIKNKFKDNREKYDTFLSMMKEYKEKRIDNKDVAAIVKEMFKGHNDLILGMNTFLPKDCQIQLPLEDEQLPLITLPKECEIQPPLEDEPLPLNTILPMEYEIQPPLEDEQPPKTIVIGNEEDATNFVNKVKARFQGNSQVYKSFLGIMNMLGDGILSINQAYLEVAALFQGHDDLLQELTHFLPGASGAASS